MNSIKAITLVLVVTFSFTFMGEAFASSHRNEPQTKNSGGRKYHYTLIETKSGKKQYVNYRHNVKSKKVDR